MLIKTDRELYEELQSRKEDGIIKITSPNHREVIFQQIMQSDSSEPAQISRLNTQVHTLFDCQRDRQSRLEEFLSSRTVSQIAADLLSISCNLGPEATVDFIVAGAFDQDQISLIRSVGVKMASNEEIQKHKELRTIPMEHKDIPLDAKPKEGETEVFTEVLFSISIYS